MKQQIKKIIAREGLIIIASMIFIGASYYILLLIIDHKISSYESNAKQFELFSTEAPEWQKLLSHDKLRRGNILTHLYKNVQFHKDTPDDVINKTLERDFQTSDKTIWLPRDKPRSHDKTSRYYDEKGNPIFNSIFFKIDFSDFVDFFLITYLLYWLARFIFWSIRPLKEK